MSSSDRLARSHAGGISYADRGNSRTDSVSHHTDDSGPLRLLQERFVDRSARSQYGAIARLRGRRPAKLYPVSRILADFQGG